MKKHKIWEIIPMLGLIAALIINLVVTIFIVNRKLFYIELGLTVLVFALVAWRLIHTQNTIKNVLKSLASALDLGDRNSLSNFPFPVLVCSESGEVVSYNDLFLEGVLNGKNVFGENIDNLLKENSNGDKTLYDLSRKQISNISYGERYYTVVYSQNSSRNSTLNILYFIDDTDLKKIAEEYALSRPAVMLFYIDNMDELLQNSRESERAHISGQIELLLEDWASTMSGILRKYSTERFLLVLEDRHLKKVISEKFNILDKIREIRTSDDQVVTVSIGVGQGESFREAEKNARQSIDMSLGRGGDQAAVKTANGFDFFGGVSRGIEKQTKVRSRIVASALMELVQNSDVVYVTGHRNSDLDSLGSSTALASAIRSTGKEAYVIVNLNQTMASELIDRYVEAGHSDLFVEPDDVIITPNRNILGIITDTHNPHIVEHPDLVSKAKNLVVIDHHRKMVDFIDNAVIFFHDPNASSASEMVTELIQYMDKASISRLDAESLMAGIALDTRNFVIRAGVRTFEAAAYLRRQGADTIQVRRMFSGSMDMYKQKIDIVSQAEMYGKAAVSLYEERMINSPRQFRIAAAQAADELLYIRGVDASFVLFEEEGTIVISARSLGEYNVQLVMETLGGGGHLTMAGAQLKGVSLGIAYNTLVEAIDKYLTDQKLDLPKIL